MSTPEERARAAAERDRLKTAMGVDSSAPISDDEVGVVDLTEAGPELPVEDAAPEPMEQRPMHGDEDAAAEALRAHERQMQRAVEENAPLGVPMISQLPPTGAAAPEVNAPVEEGRTTVHRGGLGSMEGTRRTTTGAEVVPGPTVHRERA